MNTNIFIKSFNRPYYLDRCLSSIFRFVEGNYQITILDDGTPKIYLDKIQEKYPSVKILTSENYEAKTKAIGENLTTGKEINGFEIPTKLWRNAVKNGSEYCIVTEDDVWFIAPINVDDLSEKAKKYQISLLKLSWLGNFRDNDWQEINSIDNKLNSIKPKGLFLSNPILMDWFFYNKYKFFTICYKLGIFDNYIKRKYWSLNSILMGFWHKDYWLYIWKDADGKVDEKQQLRNAAIYYKKQKKNPNFIARLKIEAMKTTFQSSATNSYHEYGFDFDVNLFNHLINEAWLRGDFDAMQNFPKDFSMEYFTPFISDKINVEEFQKWTNQFKNQYRNLGINTD